MKTIHKSIGWIIAVILTTLSLCYFSESATCQTNPNVTDVLPDLTFTKPDGTKFKLSDLKGEIVILNFLNNRCDSRTTIGKNYFDLCATYNEYAETSSLAKKQIAFVNVVFGSLADEIVKEALQLKATNKSILFVKEDKDWESENLKLLNVASVPYSLLLDESGAVIRGFWADRVLEVLNKPEFKEYVKNGATDENEFYGRLHYGLSDYESALQYFKKAEKLNGSEYMRAECHWMAKEDSEALTWHQKAFEKGFTKEGGLGLAKIYDYQSSVVPGDLRKAFVNYQAAAEAGGRTATRELALFYLFGQGGAEKNYQKAITLLEKARGLNDTKAATYLKVLEEQRKGTAEFVKKLKNSNASIKVIEKVQEPYTLSNANSSWLLKVSADFDGKYIAEETAINAPIDSVRIGFVTTGEDLLTFRKYSPFKNLTENGELSFSFSQNKIPTRTVGYVTIVVLYYYSINGNVRTIKDSLSIPYALCWPEDK